MSAAGGDAGRQTLLVALCVLGLVVAALAMGPSGGAGMESGTVDLSDLLELFVDEDDDRASACEIVVRGEVVPGERAEIGVLAAGDPVEGARVFVNDRPVGRTDASGVVAGEIPYERPVRVRARLPGGRDCRGGGAAVEPAALGAGPATAPLAGASSPPTDVAGPRASLGENVTRTFTTSGRIRLAVEGRPYPGDTVALVATVADRPVPDATVRVDGERVGTTDAAGRYRLDVPADGTRRLALAVERGDYRGTRDLTVALLSASVSPASVLATPGGEATLTAKLGDQPVDDATVTLDGTRLGETGPDGQLRFTLPAALDAHLRVRAADQTATVSVGLLYGGTAALVGLGLVVLGVAAVAFGRRVPAATPSADAGRLRTRSRRLLNRVVSGALGLATRAAALLDAVEARLRGLWAAVRTGPRALAERLRAVRHLPRRLAAALVAAWRWLRDLPRALLAAVRGSDGGDDGGDDGGADESGAVPGPEAATDPSDLREQWRAFARWVVPDRWRQRTPGEVARAAREQGYPREPVSELATVFRDVEYGGRPLSAARAARASDSFDALAAHRDAEGAPTTDREGGTEGDG